MVPPTSRRSCSTTAELTPSLGRRDASNKVDNAEKREVHEPQHSEPQPSLGIRSGYMHAAL
jgi:hypothetical protein